MPRRRKFRGACIDPSTSPSSAHRFGARDVRSDPSSTHATCDAEGSRRRLPANEPFRFEDASMTPRTSAPARTERNAAAHYVSCALREIKAAGSDGEMIFTGYGAVFGNVDSYGDAIDKGAFKR